MLVWALTKKKGKGFKIREIYIICIKAAVIKKKNNYD